MPSSKRPPLMTSMVEAILAVRAGFRNPVQTTMWPRRTRSVAIARAARTENDSKVISSVGSGTVWKWSNTHSDSKPSASACLASSIVRAQASAGASRRTRPSSPAVPSDRPASVPPDGCGGAHGDVRAPILLDGCQRLRPDRAAPRSARPVGLDRHAIAPRRAAVPHDRDDRGRARDRGTGPDRGCGAGQPVRGARRRDPPGPRRRRAGRRHRLRDVRARGAGRGGDPARGDRAAPRIRSAQAFELSLEPPSSGLVIGISHEGATGATNAALTAARAAGASTALITVTSRSPGAALADIVVETHELDQSWCHTVGYVSPIAAARGRRPPLGHPRVAVDGSRPPGLRPAVRRGRPSRSDRRGARRRRPTPRHRLRRGPPGRSRARAEGRGGRLAARRVPRSRDVPARPPRRDGRPDRHSS